MEKISTLGAAARRESLEAANDALLADTTWTVTENHRKRLARNRAKTIETIGARALLQHREFTTKSLMSSRTTNSYRLFMIEDGPEGLPNTQSNYMYLPHQDLLAIDAKLLNDGDRPATNEHWFTTKNPDDMDEYWQALQRLQNL